MVTEAETGMVICDDRGATSQGMQAPLEEEKGKETYPPPVTPEGMQPNWHLDFGPIKPISDFWPQELQKNKCILF